MRGLSQTALKCSFLLENALILKDAQKTEQEKSIPQRRLAEVDKSRSGIIEGCHCLDSSLKEPAE